MRAIPTWFWVTWAGIFGLMLGSFFTALAHRWPREESMVAPRSHCTNCNHTLSWFELVPVLSWVALRGRCRSCKTAVSVRYPLTELATGALAALAIATVGANLRGAAAAVMLVALVPVVIIDLEHKLIPDVIVFPATAAALTLAVLSHPGRWWVPVVSALGASAFLLGLHLAKPGGMGLGDVKLALLLGAVLGAGVIPAFAVAFLTGAILGVVMMVRGGAAARKMAIPFGPFLAAGAFFALWWGAPVISWYRDSFL
jgi:leader peptidase (prepilin peptidase) / N-methyltransferase